MYFSALLYVFFVVFLIFLFVVVKMKDKNLGNLVIGSQALSLFQTYQEGEKLHFYVQQSAKCAANDSVKTFLKNGGFENPKRILGLADWTENKPDFKKEFSKIFYNELIEYLDRSEEYIPKEYKIEIIPKTDSTIINGILLKNTILLSGSSTPQDLIWPTGTFSGKYSVASSFGQRIHPITKKQHFHKGIDIDSDTKEIYAVKSGRVELVNKGCSNCYYNSNTDKSDDSCFNCGSFYGNYVLINHGNLKTLYAHLEKVNVDEGQIVNQGDVIGIMGSSGSSTSPHLHFEIRINNQQVNPLCYYQGLEVEVRDQKKQSCGETQYLTNLSFSTQAELNLEQYEKLYLTIKNIVEECKISTNKEECYNSKLSSIGYNEDCYEDFEKPFYEVLKTINYCNATLDNDCYCSVDLTKISKIDFNGNYEISFIRDSNSGRMLIATNLGEIGLKDYFDLIKILGFENNGFIEEENNFVIRLNYNKDGTIKKIEFQKIPAKALSTNLEIVLFKHENSVYIVNPRYKDEIKKNFNQCTLKKNIYPVCINNIRFAIRIN